MAAPIERLRAEGVRTKIQQRTSGPHRGGIPFARGSLFHLLKNPVYRGKIVHKGLVHDGEHEPIVDDALWTAVQAQLARKAPPRQRASNDPQDALLRGLLTDSEADLCGSLAGIGPRPSTISAVASKRSTVRTSVDIRSGDVLLSPQRLTWDQLIIIGRKACEMKTALFNINLQP